MNTHHIMYDIARKVYGPATLLRAFGPPGGGFTRKFLGPEMALIMLLTVSVGNLTARNGPVSGNADFCVQGSSIGPVLGVPKLP